MAELQLLPLLSATTVDQLWPALEPFFGPDGEPPVVEATRLQPPICYWAVYRGGKNQDQRVTFKSFFQGDQFADYVDQLEQFYADRLGHPSHPQGGLTLLPDLNAVLWAFPFDPTMPNLWLCLDSDRVAAVLERRPADGALLHEVRSYRPEQGTLLAYREAASGRVVAYGKATPTGTCGLVYVVMEHLWNTAARRTGQIRLARPLAILPEAGLLLQAPVTGEPIGRDRNRAQFMDLARSAGPALAALHTTGVAFGPQRTLDELLERVRSGLTEVSLTAPGLYRTLQHLTQQIDARAAKSRGVESVPSHGDFKYDQFLHSRGRFTLIDFELFCQAEPALDLGTFCAYLPPSVPEDWRDSAAAEMLRSAFLAAYADCTAASINFDRLGLYEAAMLAIRALNHLWMHHAGWQTSASALLDLAFERLLNPEPAAVSNIG